MTAPQHGGDRLVVDLGREVGITYFEESLFGKLQRRYAEGIRVPGIADIRSDLARMMGPVPARVSRGKQGKDDYLRLYVNGQYVLVLSVSKYGQGYIVGDVYVSIQGVSAVGVLDAPAVWVLEVLVQVEHACGSCPMSPISSRLCGGFVPSSRRRMSRSRCWRRGPGP